MTENAVITNLAVTNLVVENCVGCGGDDGPHIWRHFPDTITGAPTVQLDPTFPTYQVPSTLLFPTTTQNGPSRRFAFNAIDGSLRAGEVTSNQWDTRGDNSVAFGLDNTVPPNSNNSTIAGGTLNSILLSENAFIGGGTSNTIDPSSNAFIGGGRSNRVLNSNDSAVITGFSNLIDSGTGNFIGTGLLTRILNNSEYCFIGTAADDTSYIDGSEFCILGGCGQQCVIENSNSSGIFSARFCSIRGGATTRMDASAICSGE